MARRKLWIHSAHLHKGALHRWAEKPLGEHFTKSELDHLEHRARSDLRHAHRTHDKSEQGHALHHLRMVLFAKRARHFHHGR